VSACVVGKFDFVRWFMNENRALKVQRCGVCLYAKIHTNENEFNLQMNGQSGGLENCVRETEIFRSLTSYKAQQQQQQLEGYSLHEKATYTHFHVYVLCTLVPFISSVYRRRQHKVAYFPAIVDKA
jgi:hypothetical protein